MAAFIAIFLAFIAVVMSVLSFFSTKKAGEEGNGNLDEIMRLKQQINEMHDKIAKLQYDHTQLAEQYKKLQEVSINADMQNLLNTVIKEYNDIANTTPEEGGKSKHEKKRKAAAEKVIKACNEVCERFIAEDLSHNTFVTVYKSQLQSILNSDDLKDIYTSVKAKYPYIERVLFSPIDDALVSPQANISAN